MAAKKTKKQKDPSELNVRQEKFLTEYIKEINDAHAEKRQTRARDAAIRAGYSAKSANSTASELMKIPKIKARIAEEIESIVGASREQTRLDLISRLRVTAFSDISLFVDDEGFVLPPAQWPKGAGVAVKDIVNVPTQNGMRTELKLKDDKQSQELLIKLLTLIEDKPKKIELDISMKTPEQQDAELKDLLKKME